MQRNDPDVRIDFGQFFRKHLDFFSANVFGVIKQLAIQIAQFNSVKIIEPKSLNPKLKKLLEGYIKSI